MNARGVKPRPDPRQLELNFDSRPTLKDYANLLVASVIYGRAFVDFRGRVYTPRDIVVSPHDGGTRGTRPCTIILDDIEWTSQRPNS